MRTKLQPGQKQRQRQPGPVAPRFWSKVLRGADSACWPWLGALQAGRGEGAYGLFAVKRGDRWCGTTAHRVAYELTHGSAPSGLEIDHLCRNRRCCNPAHLEAVTRTENQRRGQVARKAVAA